MKQTRRLDTHFATELGFIEQNRRKASGAFTKVLTRMCHDFSATLSLFVSLRARKCEIFCCFRAQQMTERRNFIQPDDSVKCALCDVCWMCTVGVEKEMGWKKKKENEIFV